MSSAKDVVFPPQQEKTQNPDICSTRECMHLKRGHLKDSTVMVVKLCLNPLVRGTDESEIVQNVVETVSQTSLISTSSSLSAAICTETFKCRSIQNPSKS